MVTSEAVYFREGSGYYLVHIIDHGVMALTCIVRSRANGKLYIRKQTLDRSYNPSSSINNDDPEIYYGKFASQIPGTAKMIGYTEYLHTEARTCYTASYWEYYSGESLSQYLEDFVDTRRSPPENFVWYMFSTMLQTLIQCQLQGLAHGDAHGGNWFLQFTRPNSYPSILLGDFGESKTMLQLDQQLARNEIPAEEREYQWIINCQDGPKRLAVILGAVVENCPEEEKAGILPPSGRSIEVPYSTELFQCISELKNLAHDGARDLQVWQRSLIDLQLRVEHQYQTMLTEAGDNSWVLEPKFRSLNHHMTLREYEDRERKFIGMVPDEFPVWSIATLDGNNQFISTHRPRLSQRGWQEYIQERLHPEF